MFTLLCSHTTFPHPPLVSPKFSHVPLGIVGGRPLGYKKGWCLVIVRAIRFQDFQPTCSWSTNVTDGQTDRRMDGRHGGHAIAIPRFALYIVHRAVKTSFLPGLCPGPPSGGAYDAPPGPVVGWGGSTPAHALPASTPSASRSRLGSYGASVLRPHQ